MTTTNNPQSPAAVEQDGLAALERQNQQTMAYVQSCPVGSSPQVMLGWVQSLDGYVAQYQQLAPLAGWLSLQGLPQMLQRLETSLADLNHARQIYAQMYQGMLQTEVRIGQIWNSANQYATASILEATQHSNAVFQRCQQGWFDIMEERCYDCHRFVSIPGGGYCYECARRRGRIY